MGIFQWLFGKNKSLLSSPSLGVNPMPRLAMSPTTQKPTSRPTVRAAPQAPQGTSTTWKDAPATEKQLAYLAKFGFIQKGLTKGEASTLIDKFVGDPERLKIRNQNNSEEMLRTHSYYMDNTAVCLREQLEEAKKALSNTKKGEVADARSDLADVRRDRLQFWKDTFVEPMKSESEGQSMDFFIKWGHRFQAPTKTQIQAVLDTLDVSLGNWESTNPEAFFGMVQANFSDLVRR